MKKVRWLLLLHVLFFVYALTGLCGKIAATYSWDSIAFWEYYCGMIVLLAIYAIGWQMILRYIPLSTAYTHRAITIFWGLIIGHFFFGEAVTLGKIAGVGGVMCGLVFFSMDWQTDDT